MGANLVGPRVTAGHNTCGPHTSTGHFCVCPSLLHHPAQVPPIPPPQKPAMMAWRRLGPPFNAPFDGGQIENTLCTHLPSLAAFLRLLHRVTQTQRRLIMLLLWEKNKLHDDEDCSSADDGICGVMPYLGPFSSGCCRFVKHEW